MQYLRIVIGIVLTATCVLCALPAASAWAVESPEFTVETGYKGTGATAIFEVKSGTKVTCKESTIEGSAESKKAGKYRLVEAECATIFGIKCTNISVSGEWKLVAKPGGGTFLLFETPGAHFECASLFIEITGTFLTQISPFGSGATTKYEVSAFESKGKQEFAEYENESGEKIKTQLLVALGHGTFEEAGEEALETELTTLKATELRPMWALTLVSGNRRYGAVALFGVKEEEFTYETDSNEVTINTAKVRTLVGPKSFAIASDTCSKRGYPTRGALCVITVKFSATTNEKCNKAEPCEAALEVPSEVGPKPFLNLLFLRAEVS